MRRSGPFLDHAPPVRRRPRPVKSARKSQSEKSAEAAKAISISTQQRSESGAPPWWIRAYD